MPSIKPRWSFGDLRHVCHQFIEDGHVVISVTPVVMPIPNAVPVTNPWHSKKQLNAASLHLQGLGSFRHWGLEVECFMGSEFRIHWLGRSLKGFGSDGFGVRGSVQGSGLGVQVVGFSVGI